MARWTSSPSCSLTELSRASRTHRSIAVAQASSTPSSASPFNCDDLDPDVYPDDGC